MEKREEGGIKIFNHAYTLAYVVVSPHQADKVTLEEHLTALAARMTELWTDEGEAREATLTQQPFDTFEFQTGYPSSRKGGIK